MPRWIRIRPQGVRAQSRVSGRGSAGFELPTGAGKRTYAPFIFIKKYKLKEESEWSTRKTRDCLNIRYDRVKITFDCEDTQLNFYKIMNVQLSVN